MSSDEPTPVSGVPEALRHMATSAGLDDNVVVQPGLSHDDIERFYRSQNPGFEPDEVADPIDPPMQPSPVRSQWSLGTADLSTGLRVGVTQISTCVGTFALFLSAGELRAISGQMSDVADDLEANPAVISHGD